jgi:hypothetical protein
MMRTMAEPVILDKSRGEHSRLRARKHGPNGTTVTRQLHSGYAGKVTICIVHRAGCFENLVDLVGFEPTTSSMPWKRAPNCATGPLGAEKPASEEG